MAPVPAGVPRHRSGAVSRLPYDASVTDIVDPELEAYAEAHTTAPPPYLEALADRATRRPWSRPA